ncbi:MAG: hypothetical protein RR576_09650 [Oscillospiraceae bacterium]
MKKFMSIALVLALAAAMSVTAFAAKTTGNTKAEMNALLDQNASKYGASAEQLALAKNSVDAMTDAAVAKIDVVQVKTAAEPTLAKKAAGTLTATDLKAAETAVNAALAPAGVSVSVEGLSIKGKNIYGKPAVAISAAASKTGEAVKITVDLGENPDDAPFNPVIKKTGADLNMTGVSVLAFAVVAVLGAGVVVTRKLGLAE